MIYNNYDKNKIVDCLEYVSNKGNTALAISILKSNEKCSMYLINIGSSLEAKIEGINLCSILFLTIENKNNRKNNIGIDNFSSTFTNKTFANKNKKQIF